MFVEQTALVISPHVSSRDILDWYWWNLLLLANTCRVNFYDILFCVLPFTKCSIFIHSFWRKYSLLREKSRQNFFLPAILSNTGHNKVKILSHCTFLMLICRNFDRCKWKSDEFYTSVKQINSQSLLLTD